MTLIVTGLKEVDKALRELPTKIQKKVARKVLREVGKPMLKDLRAKAHFATGQYKKTIKLSVRKAKYAKQHGEKDTIGIRIGTNRKALDKYAERERAKRQQSNWFFNPHWLEYGNVNHGPRPHFRPVMDSWKSRVGLAFRRIFKRTLSEVTKGTK